MGELTAISIIFDEWRIDGRSDIQDDIKFLCVILSSRRIGLSS